jgi:hypothetical protein
LSADDLNNLRFAFSPMRELSSSFWALRNPARYAVHLPWINEAHAALDAVELPCMHALITPEGQFADFLHPTPSTPRPSFEEELDHLRHTPSDEIVSNVNRLRIRSETAQRFLDDPQGMLKELVAEVELYWQRTLAHHWSRIHAVLESDVIYRSRRLGLEGVDAVFNDLHWSIHYRDMVIQIDTRHERTLVPGGSGLTLVPLIFMWNDVLVPEDSVNPVIGYNPRGSGLWTHTAETPGEALIATLGAGRAAVLRQLITPQSTSELAERLNVTAGNISLHIARLREAGLVESQQISKWVFHRLTERGEGLLALFDPE